MYYCWYKFALTAKQPVRDATTCKTQVNFAMAGWWVKPVLAKRVKRLLYEARRAISSRRVYLRNATSGISDPICKNHHTFALGRDRKFHACSNFH